MRLYRIVLVLLFTVVVSQGHPLSKDGLQENKPLTANPDEPEKISKPDLKPKPENPEVDLKPEIPASDLKPQSDVAPPPPLAPEIQKPCSSIDKDCGIKEDFNLERKSNEYDQRQNGTENYRIQVDGLVLVLAPVEALLMAGGAGSDINVPENITSLLNPSNLKASYEYSEPEPIRSDYKPHSYSASKPSEGPVSIKLINLIAPLLEQRRHFGI